MSKFTIMLLIIILCFTAANIFAQDYLPVIPKEQRGGEDFVREGTHDANRIRTMFFNYGMAGNYETSPDYTIFHSMEWPKGSLESYSDGVTPFVLAKLQETVRGNLQDFWIMETGYRERQETNPLTGRLQRFNPRPGYLQLNPEINRGRSPAVSHDPRTWPDGWPDKANDPDDPGWSGSWNGYFGKMPNADQESFCVYDDDYYGKWNFYPDVRDNTRRGMALKVDQRGFQWSNVQSRDVIFWHYDISNEGTTIYNYNVIFGLYMDSGVGGGALSPFDLVYESDDDNAAYDIAGGNDLVYTWDYNGFGNFGRTGYLGYAYLETPGNPVDLKDNDLDGITDEKRDGGPGQKIVGQGAILSYIAANYDTTKLNELANFRLRPAFQRGIWWTGDEDMDWTEGNDAGADGVFGTFDTGEGDSIPTLGEPSFDRTDLNESDQIGLTGFKLNRIRAGAGVVGATDDIIFFMDAKQWPRKLYEMWSGPNPFEAILAVRNYNIGFLFASGPFYLGTGKTERFSLALAFGADLHQMQKTVQIVQTIYDANYQFATPPPTPTVHAFPSDGYVTLTWDNAAENAFDPISNTNDFEGYKIYRSTDESFLDPQIIYDAQGVGLLGPGKPLAVYDLNNGILDYSAISVEGIQYFLGNDSGVRHTFKDTAVTNGQRYFYAVTAYDRGIEKLNVYPSESSISVNQTLRGGLILPKNVVIAYPNAKAPGYTPGVYRNLEHVQGYGFDADSIYLEIPNPDLIPKNHTYEIRFKAPDDSIRADSYEMFDVTDGKNDTVFVGGKDFLSLGWGPIGAGMLPMVFTIKEMETDSLFSGFTPNSQSNMVLKPRISRTAVPANAKRPNYPADYSIIFDDVVIDTSIGAPSVPSVFTKFTVIGRVKATGQEFPVDFRFFDTDGNQTISRSNEFIEILSRTATGTRTPVWRVTVDSINGPKYSNSIFPKKGDVYQLVINVPLNEFDVYRFTTDTSFIDQGKLAEDYNSKPYVVPNPYLGMASFEQAPYAQTGRGDRRIEFRGIPVNATVRIYTVNGELVQTLIHDSGFQNYIPWNLRSKDNLEIAPGLYIFHVEADGMDDFIGKFAIVK